MHCTSSISLLGTSLISGDSYDGAEGGGGAGGDGYDEVVYEFQH